MSVSASPRALARDICHARAGGRSAGSLMSRRAHDFANKVPERLRNDGTGARTQRHPPWPMGGARPGLLDYSSGGSLQVQAQLGALSVAGDPRGGIGRPPSGSSGGQVDDVLRVERVHDGPLDRFREVDLSQTRSTAAPGDVESQGRFADSPANLLPYSTRLASVPWIAPSWKVT